MIVIVDRCGGSRSNIKHSRPIVVVPYHTHLSFYLSIYSQKCIPTCTYTYYYYYFATVKLTRELNTQVVVVVVGRVDPRKVLLVDH